MSDPYNRGLPATWGEATGKRRLSKRNPSDSMLTTINTSTSTLNSILPLRPSPSSSRSDNLLSPVDAPRPPLDSRQQSKVSLSTDSSGEDRPGGMRKKMSLTGSMLGKKPSNRLGLGSMRSLSDASLVETPDERNRVLAEIKEKAEKDRSIAHKHAASCSVLGAPATNHLHPIRRRSLLTPGLATRDASDPLRKPPADGRIERLAMARQRDDQPPATGPLSRPPPPSTGAAYRPPYANLLSPEPLPSMRLAPLDLAAEDSLIGTPRSSTPSERDYGRLGSGLRITNGIASPNPSVGSGRWSNASPVPQRSHTMGEHPFGASNDPIANFKQPLKSRLYMIENANRPGEELDESNIHPAFRSRPPFEEAPKSDALARQYQADLPDSPYDSSIDLNKPLPTPPGSDVKAAPKPLSTKSSTHSRSASARPDLDYRRRESLTGDVGGRQEDLYDETLSLLESIGSTRSDSSKPQHTSTTTTTTTTTPSHISYTKENPEHENRPTITSPPVTKIVTSTGPITSIVRTTLVSNPKRQVQGAPHSAGVASTMHESPTAGTFSPIDAYPRSSTMKGQTRVGLIRNDDSGYSSSSYASSRSQQAPPRPLDTELGSSSAPRQTPRSQPPQASPRHRPSLSITSRATPSGSYTSRHAHSSSESSTTLLSIRNAVPTPLSPSKRRLKKFRPTSLPPVERIPVQGQKAYTSSFIPPVPQDIAARHAQRSAEHPPLAHTVANVGHARKPSGSGMAPMSAPMSAPLQYPSPSPGHPSEERSSGDGPSIDLPNLETSINDYPGSEGPSRPRRNSKGFFSAHVLKFVDPTKSTGSESKAVPRSASRAERRAASRQKQRDEEDFDEDEGAVLTDLYEVDELYGASPYDAAASPKSWTGANASDPYRHPTAPRSRNTFGMTKAQASEVNRLREQNRWNPSIEERMVTAPEQRPTLPVSAPASEQYFARNEHGNPYSNAYRNREWDRSPSHDQLPNHVYDNRGPEHGPPYILAANDWQRRDDTWNDRYQADNGHGHPMPVRRFSDKPTHPSSEVHSSDGSYRRPDSGRSQTAPASPITPMDGHDSYNEYGRLDQGDDRGHYGEDAMYGRYGGEDTNYGYEPGRYDGGFAYGYEHGRGVNGSAGTRDWQNDTSRKSIGMGQQYGIDLTDVPVFVGPHVAT